MSKFLKICNKHYTEVKSHCTKSEEIDGILVQLNPNTSSDIKTTIAHWKEGIQKNRI